MTEDWTALVFARWVNLVSVAGLFGMAVFPLYAPTEARRTFLGQPTICRLFVAGGTIAFVSTFGWAGAALVNMTGDVKALADPDAWLSFLFGTSFGLAWIVRLALAVALSLSVFRGERALGAIAALTACLLVSQAWIGHVASLASPARWGVAAAYTLHVLGAGTWFGGILALIILLDGKRIGEDRRAVVDALERFSVIGLIAVLAILVGGIVNALAIYPLSLAMPSWTGLFTSAWWQTLVAKIALVAAMLGLAGLNRFVWTPRLASGDSAAYTNLVRSVVIEQFLGVAVLAVTAILGVLDPSG